MSKSSETQIPTIIAGKDRSINQSITFFIYIALYNNHELIKVLEMEKKKEKKINR